MRPLVNQLLLENEWRNVIAEDRADRDFIRRMIFNDHFFGFRLTVKQAKRPECFNFFTRHVVQLR